MGASAPNAFLVPPPWSRHLTRTVSPSTINPFILLTRIFMDLYSTQHPATVKPYCILFYTLSFSFDLIFLVSLGMLVPNSRD